MRSSAGWSSPISARIGLCAAAAVVLVIVLVQSMSFGLLELLSGRR